MSGIPADDRGFALGDGLFETLLAEGGELRRLSAHLDRMTAACAVLGLPAPDRAEAGRLMARALADSGLAQARAAVRLTLTAGSGGRGLERPATPTLRLVARAAAAPKPATPARLAVSGVRRNEGSPASRLKTLSYLDNVLAREAALAAGFDEAVLLNNRGEVACAAAANIFWVKDGRLFTPALDCGVLAGTTRARVLAAISVTEARADLAELRAVEAMFLANSLIGLRAVTELEGRTMSVWSGLGALAAAVD